ncbi:MAG: 30S ribosomal protein S17 [Candidatus Magasanikbacteria bacterium]|nr:30S ribosomal protein S17 [Candidatus Magasanikbacteria bacterium]
MKTNKVQRRRLEGVVVSVKEHKTIHVCVTTIKMHPKYNKQFSTKKNYAVHDEHARAQLGDKVVCEACRPMSKTKSWTLVKVL